MRAAMAGATAVVLATLATVAAAGRAYSLNEDSHPHDLLPGASARFTPDRSAAGALMDVECSLQGDNRMPAGKVMPPAHGLTDVDWPFASRSIRVERLVDFDILARVERTDAGAGCFECVDEDPDRRLWHRCHNK